MREIDDPLLSLFVKLSIITNDDSALVRDDDSLGVVGLSYPGLYVSPANQRRVRFLEAELSPQAFAVRDC